MNIYRSLLFIPSSSTKMLDKIENLNPDGFILDLEDSVPPQLKDAARVNVKDKIKELSGKGYPCSKKIFIRINELGSQDSKKDVEMTLLPQICGFVIPKFEDIEKLKIFENELAQQEKNKGINLNKTKIILMVESSAGLVELLYIKKHRTEDYFKRIIAIALGFEDFTRSMTVLGELSVDMLDYIRKTTVSYAKANGFLAIDTVYKNFRDADGLREDTSRAAGMGFDGKLLIHPSQIDIVNSCFMPPVEDIKRMEAVLANKERIEKEGAISIEGVMYDTAHLKWALVVKNYLDKINSN